MKRLSRANLTALVAAAVVVLLGVAALTTARVLESRNQAYDFALTDQNGQIFRLSQERGHAVALFFGYTHCPDVCPATLARLAAARASLGKDRNDIRVVFVTVDPRRDTPQRMKTYLATFDPSFVGVTGTERQLAPVYRAYHVWYQELPKTTAGLEALEAHTATITLIDRTGHLQGFADWSDSIAVLAQHFRAAAS